MMKTADVVELKIDSIPRIIHQVFGLWDPKIPKHIQKRMDTWKKLHPRYKYILWNKTKCRKFIKEKYNWFLSMYDGYEYNVQRADSVRYFILYEYGGVYSDIDLVPHHSIEPLLKRCDKKSCVFYRSPNSDKITNDFMFCKPKSMFWKKVFKELMMCHSIDYFSKHLTVMYSTGPLLIDNVFNSNMLKPGCVYIIDAKYINNCDVSEVKPARNEKAYLIRYEGNAWHGFDSSVINFLYTYYSHLLLMIVIVALVYNTPM